MYAGLLRPDGEVLKAFKRVSARGRLQMPIAGYLTASVTYALLPAARSKVKPWLFLSYFDPASGLYGCGPEDVKLVLSFVALLMGLRTLVMQAALRPLALRLGVRTPKIQDRFAEQGWLLVYVTTLWSVGMYIYACSPYYADLSAIWTAFPSTRLPSSTKAYYLVQLAFWIQQIVVIHLEERRRDHWQMLAHHILTTTLITCSYGFYQTKVGNVILCVMDSIDVVLPIAKMLQYCGYRKARDIAFGIFLFTWLWTRHVLFLKIWWSVYVESPALIEWGCYSTLTGLRLAEVDRGAQLKDLLNGWRGSGLPVCVDDGVHRWFLVSLGVLQIILLVWFGAICSIAYGVLTGKGARDTRSEAGDTTEGETSEGDNSQSQPDMAKTEVQRVHASRT